ncbi:ABC transporter substrate-binding protein [Chakrabartyella piscis]|uniref:ABC transporter substrate-binding protein n=1 Tax=Chakrabartyella piscis TaxID=2918914 RepID=UPI0029583C49|nr:ABC transporter substrate-binding protein [Chakrabartyella piscis]
MKIMKQIVPMAMAAVLAFGATGCGTTASSSTTTADGKVEIEYWHINSESFAGPTVTDIVKRFNESQDEIVVKEKYIGEYQSIMQNLQADAAVGTSPDLVQIGWSYKEYFGNNFAYTDPNELFAEYGTEETKNFIDDTYAESVQALAVLDSGEMLGMPYGMSIPMLFLNTDIFAEAGIAVEDLVTWWDVDAAARTIAENTDKYGLYIGESNYVWEMQQLIESNGARYITDGICSIYSPESVEAMELYAGLVHDGSALHVVIEEGRQAYLAGEVGIYMDSVAYTNITTTTTDFTEIMVAPGWEDEELQLPIGGNFLAVTSSTDEKKAATAEFLTWMLDAENMLQWNGVTGYIPPIKSAVGSEFMAENPVIQMAYDNLDSAVPWAAFPGNNGLQAEQILIAMRDEILSSGTPSEEAMKKAQEEINKMY